MDDHLAKPIDAKKMIEVLCHWLAPSAEPIESSQPDETIPQKAEFCLPGFDFTELLLLFDGDQDQLITVLHMFLEDFAHIDQAIGDTIAKGDYESAHRLLHQMKGTAGNIGAIELHAISDTFDKQLKQSQLDGETYRKWQVVFKNTMQTVSSALKDDESKALTDETLPGMVLDDAEQAFLVSLDHLLAEDQFLTNEVLDQLMDLAGKKSNADIAQAIALVRKFRYAEARELLSALIKPKAAN